MKSYAIRRMSVSLLSGVALIALLAGCDDLSVVSTEDLIARAKESRAAGDVQAATIDLKAALADEPDNAAARFLLAQVYLDAGDGVSAEKELQRAIDGGMKREDLLPAMAQAWLQLGSYQKVLDEVQPLTPDRSPVSQATVFALRGRAHLELGLLDEAGADFTEALRLDSDSTNAQVGAARVAMARKDYDQAKSILEAALAGAPKDFEALRASGSLAFILGDYDGAIVKYQSLVKSRPLLIVPRIELVRALIAGKRPADAVKELGPVLKSAPKLPVANLLRAMAAYDSDDMEAAVVYGEKVADTSAGIEGALIAGAAHYALGHNEQAVNHLGRYLATVPGSVDARRILAAAQMQLSQPDQALATIDPLLSPGSDDLALVTMAGIAALATGDPALGTIYLQRAVELRPDDAAALTRLGVVRLASGDTTGGIDDLQSATELDSEFVGADMILIQTHLRAGEFQKALDAAKALLEKQPDQVAPYISMGLAYRGLGDPTAAREAFEAALKVNPDHVGAGFAIAELDLADGNFDAVRARYDALLAKDPKHFTAIMRMAALEQIQGNVAAMKPWLDRALTVKPEAFEPRLMLAQLNLANAEPLKALGELSQISDDYADHPAYLQALGQAELDVGRATDATATLERLVRAVPQWPEAHFLLARAYGAIGNAGRVVSELREALKLRPDYGVARIALIRQLESTDQSADADVEFKALKEAAPDDPNVAALAGWLALRRGQATEAVAAFQAARAAGSYSQLEIDLASAQWQSNDPAGAIKTLSDWIADHPEDMTAQLELANLHLLGGDPVSAKSTLETIVAAQPDNWVALNNLADVLLASDPAAAMGHAQKAHDLMPAAIPVTVTLSRALIANDKSDEAVLLMRETLRTVPENPDVSFELAYALAKSGQMDEARGIVASLLATGATFQKRKDAEALRQELGD